MIYPYYPVTSPYYAVLHTPISGLTNPSTTNSPAHLNPYNHIQSSSIIFTYFHYFWLTIPPFKSMNMVTSNPHISGYLRIHNQSTTYPPWMAGIRLAFSPWTVSWWVVHLHPIHLYLSSWGSLSIWKPMGFIIISLMISLQVPSGWWYTYPSEKYESQLGWLFPKYEKIKHVSHHQPAIN